MKTADKNANDAYYIVFRWMTAELNLKGNERDVFAVIYSFSQDVNTFHGSIGYIAELINATKKTVITALKDLTERGLLEKTEKEINGVRVCDYKTCSYKYRKNVTGSVKITPPPVKNLHRGSVKITPHNKEDIKEDIIESPLYNPPVGETENIPKKKTPQNPPESDITAKTDAPPYKEILHTLKTRINALYGQKDTFLWRGKEITAIRDIARRPDVLDELQAIETLYTTDYQFKRRTIYALLDNWTGELQKANNPENTQSQYDPNQRLELD